MPAKRGGVRTRPVEVDDRVEAEVQAIIQEPIDSTDVGGVVLRNLLVNISDQNEVELSPLLDEESRINDGRATTVLELRDIHDRQREIGEGLRLEDRDYESIHEAHLQRPDAVQDRPRPEGYDQRKGNQAQLDQLDIRYREKHELLERLRARDIEVKTELKEKRERHTERYRELFYVAPTERVGITLNVAQNVMGLMDTHLKPQKEFLEKIWNMRGGRQAYDIQVQSQLMGGGASYPGTNRVTIGLSNTSKTTPLHEFTHKVEELTPGARAKRALRAKEIVLTATGKQRLEDVELERHISWIDYAGVKHYQKVRGKYVYVPKGIFNTPQEQSDYGYMFRVYQQDINETGYGRGKKYHVRAYTSDQFGVEMPSKGTEHVYNEPVKFSKRFPDVFDLVIDLYRGKL
jgi:hypothetical protein